MPVLNWIGKDKIVEHDKDLPFRVLKPNKNLSIGESENLLIQGDNLEALKALMPFYYGKVKCIYIDPPYNTGNEGWIYNDRVNSPQIKSWLNKVVGAEGEDLCRHDKWLCMMYPRLKLLRDLLSNDGVIFVSIDDNEEHNLKTIMDEIFGEKNFVANIIWQKNYSPRNDAKYFSDMHDHIVLYAKDKEIWRPNLLPRGDKQNAYYKYDDNDGRGPWRSDNILVKSFSQSGVFAIVNPNTGKEYWPPKGSCYRFNAETAKRYLAENRFYFGKDGNGAPQVKRYLAEVKEGLTPQTIWFRDEVGDNQEAKKELSLIFGEGKMFDTPKPTRLVKRIVNLATGKDDIVLDSFAGSGTTGQAVLELNKEDGGNRKFILVELEKEISENTTAIRLKKVAEGYEQAKFPEGTSQGFEYLDLNGELFNKNGFINDDAAYEDLASYIFYTETKAYTDLTKIKSPFVGSLGNTSYYLIFSKMGESVLDQKSFTELRDIPGSKVIFADKTLVDEENLQKYNIVFKQIPYELKKF